MFAETTVERGGHVKHGNDSSAYVRFYKRNEKGVSKDFVEIMFPGDTKTIVNRQIKDDDKNRWPQHWEAYQRGEEFKADGFPLEQWTEIDEGMVRELNHKRIYTVDQLADVTDQNMANIGLGARELVAKAKAFTEVRKNTDASMKYAAQFEQMDAENKLLREENKTLAARMQALEDMLAAMKQVQTESANQQAMAAAVQQRAFDAAVNPRGKK